LITTLLSTRSVFLHPVKVIKIKAAKRILIFIVDSWIRGFQRSEVYTIKEIRVSLTDGGVNADKPNV
jgi:hypothetical protein